jgi:hypothetical protein
MEVRRFKLAGRVLPIIGIIVLTKFFCHYNNLEFLSLNSLFTAIISANIFLIGFLLSGVMSDYKESEKIPSDISSSVEAMADEGKSIMSKDKKEGKEFILHCTILLESIKEWFQGKKKTSDVMSKIDNLNNHFILFEKYLQPNYIVRMKNEQNFIRKSINRSHAIKDTNFIGSGYDIAEIITILLIFGFIFVKMDPFYESIFFVSFVSFVLVYMILLIKDLDNPFGHNMKHETENVSLKPLDQARDRLIKYLKENSL